MNHVLRLSGLMAVLVFLVATLAATGSAVSAKVDDDAKPARIGVTVTGIVEEDYADGLLLTTEDGVSYMVLTPEEVSLEQEEAFHKRNKGKSVTLSGSVFRDEDGSLSLFVLSLPSQ